jgi:hypothetical protein
LDKQEKDENTATFSDEKGSISVSRGAGYSVKMTKSDVSGTEHEKFEKSTGNETVVVNGENENTVSAGTVHLSIPYDGIVSLQNSKSGKNSYSQSTRVGGGRKNVVGNEGQRLSSEKEGRKDCDNNDEDEDEDEDVVEIIDIDIESDKDDESTGKNSDKNNEKKNSNSLWLPLTALSVQRSAYVPQNLNTAVKFNLLEGQVQNDNERVKTFFWNRFSQKIQVMQIIKYFLNYIVACIIAYF